jgi:Flp pilus assembly protein TadD
LLEWLRDHPADSRTRRYLAAAYLDAGRIREAAEQYRLLAEADPRDAQALNNLAWTLHQLGDPAALDLAQRAHQLAPESAAIADTLGWLLLQSGRMARPCRCSQGGVARLHDTGHSLSSRGGVAARG